MRTNRKMMGVFFVLSTVIFVTGAATAAGKTARSYLSRATESAKSWQGDALLTQISSGSVMEDGRSEEWIYSFYSSKSKKWFNVSIRNEKIEGVEVGFGKKDPVTDQFLDSDKAMQEAKAQGLKGRAPGMSLSVFDFSGKGGSYWMVSGGYEKGDVTIILEAKTGKLFSRNVID